MDRTEAERPIRYSAFFVAKAVYGYSTTSAIIESLESIVNLRRICGFNGVSIIEEIEGKSVGGRILKLKRKRSALPSEATFSRAFEEFAKTGLGDKVHEALVNGYLSEQIIGHISRDATAIVKTCKKERVAKRGKSKGKEGARETERKKRIDRQARQGYEEALKELPRVCDIGCKTNSQGYKQTWIGYKRHVDISDCGLPITAVLTSASLHDSQVAIPMMKMTGDRTTYLYDLMDAAYDAKQIYTTSKNLGHVPIIDRNPRRGEALPMCPAKAARYKERSTAAL